MTDCAELAEIVEDFAASTLSVHRQSEVFLASVFLEEGALIFVDIVAVLKGDFAECPRRPSAWEKSQNAGQVIGRMPLSENGKLETLS